MPYNSKAFGIVISRLRISRGLSQERMSGLAGIARSHLAALEKGEKTVKINTLWNIAYALDLKPSELICMVEKEIGDDTNRAGWDSNTGKPAMAHHENMEPIK